jgi:hypothetical protein
MRWAGGERGDDDDVRDADAAIRGFVAISQMRKSETVVFGRSW